MKTIDTDVLLSLVDDLAAYKNVAAFGHMQSGNVAHTLQHDLTDANKFIFSSSGTYFDRMFQSDLRLRRDDRPKTYMITVADVTPKPYVDVSVCLSGTYDYVSSPLLLQEYASLIALLYNEKYNH